MDKDSQQNTAVRVLGFPAFSNKNSNPYNTEFYSAAMRHGITVDEFSFRKAIFGHYEIIHIHWPEKFLNSNYRTKAALWSAILLTCIFLHRLRGGKLVWTVHNLRPHQIKYPWLYKVFNSIFLRQVDAVISLSEANQRLLEKSVNLPNVRHRAVIYHHLYPIDQTTDCTLPDSLPDIPEQFCLFFGRILPYKNVEKIIDIFTESPPADTHLVIAGAAEDSSYARTIEERIGNTKNITFINRHISYSELNTLTCNCLLGILPFKAILNSGSLIQFISLGKTVITPYSENFAEYASFFNPSPIVLYHSELTHHNLETALKNIPDTPYERPPQLSLEECGLRAASFFKTVAGN